MGTTACSSSQAGGSGTWLAGSFHLTAIVPLQPSPRCGWVTVFSSVVLAFFLLTIEEIGVVSGWAAAPLSVLNCGNYTAREGVVALGTGCVELR